MLRRYLDGDDALCLRLNGTKLDCPGPGFNLSHTDGLVILA